MKMAHGAFWSARLSALIKHIEPLGSFAHQYTLQNVPSLMPDITVQGVGRLGFPMPNIVVNELIATATKAPYGHLDKTLFDIEVRDAWQIEATKVTIGGGDVWNECFTEAVRHHCFELGISEERFDSLGIQANLYKMLLYEEGGHFLVHRDTEKEANMFGTLILQLPTSDGYSGGEVTVSHQDVTKTLDLSVGSDNSFPTVSFYADCKHELAPVTSGKRVCLAFNLVATQTEKTSILSHDVNIDTEEKLRLIWKDWNSGESKQITKIGYQLEHSYTCQSISFSTLKGRDDIVAATLRNARNSLGSRLFRISLLLMENRIVSDYLNDEYQGDEIHPFKLIEETSDGVFEEKYLKYMSQKCSREWDMMCYTRNGWWITEDMSPNVVVTDSEAAVKDAASVDENDDDEEGEAYEGAEDEDGNEIIYDRKMFLSLCALEVKENAYNGNDGGSTETFYYSAAIIISPYTTASMEDLK